MQTTIFEWENFLNVGSKSIDDDHKKILELFKVFSSLDANNKFGTILALQKLKRFTIEHFDREEKIMVEVSYPDLKNHKNLHKLFVDKLTEWETRCQHSWRAWHTTTISIVGMEWLLTHIIDEDQRIGSWIKTKRLPPKRIRKPLTEIIKILDKRPMRLTSHR